MRGAPLVQLLLLLLTFFAMPVLADDCYSIGSGGSADITAFSVCRHVYNGASLELCVPITLSDEWPSFYNNPPANVIVTPCAVGCSATGTSWSSCYGPVDALNSGQSETVTNTAGGYTGSITATCNNGSWSYSGGSCDSTGPVCSGASTSFMISWGGDMDNEAYWQCQSFCQGQNCGTGMSSYDHDSPYGYIYNCSCY